jgi:hypothetical protein
MRRAVLAGLAALALLTAPALVGCGSGEKAKIPDKQIELPKSGPSAAGAPVGAKPGKGAASQ